VGAPVLLSGQVLPPRRLTVKIGRRRCEELCPWVLVGYTTSDEGGYFSFTVPAPAGDDQELYQAWVDASGGYQPALSGLVPVPSAPAPRRP
jgi:hypothetical protein